MSKCSSEVALYLQSKQTLKRKVSAALWPTFSPQRADHWDAASCCNKRTLTKVCKSLCLKQTAWHANYCTHSRQESETRSSRALRNTAAAAAQTVRNTKRDTIGQSDDKTGKWRKWAKTQRAEQEDGPFCAATGGMWYQWIREKNTNKHRKQLRAAERFLQVTIYWNWTPDNNNNNNDNLTKK